MDINAEILQELQCIRKLLEAINERDERERLTGFEDLMNQMLPRLRQELEETYQRKLQEDALMSMPKRGD